MMKIIAKSIYKEFDIMKNQFYHENLSRQVQIAGQMRGGIGEMSWKRTLMRAVYTKSCPSRHAGSSRASSPH